MKRDFKVTDHRLIGLTGTNGAGKGEVASFYQKKGYGYLSLSDILREELKSRSLQASRDNLITCGNELRENLEPTFWLAGWRPGLWAQQSLTVSAIRPKLNTSAA